MTQSAIELSIKLSQTWRGPVCGTYERGLIARKSWWNKTKDEDERQVITGLEMSILRRAVDRQVIQAADIREFFRGQDNAIISRQIKRLIEKKMLVAERQGARKYIISFNNNYLLRAIMRSLDEKGFLPV